ncbi:MAG: hypothetical protein CL816_07905 [Coxiellaceae bacterium]|nr:hypothetical protein [Coxiellaceae bacterium]|tara:strand:- start:3887 stop:4654 length:768 start_codon:yes stop_codon:yes gene_type:complete
MRNTSSLKNTTIINSRPKHQARALTKVLESLGARVIELPVIGIKHEDKTILDKKISRLKQPDYLIFVSANAVHSLIPYYHPPKDAHVIAIGTGTAQALAQYNITTDTLPHHFSSHGILELPILSNLDNQHVVISCGANSNVLLQNQLEQRGASVQCIESYYRFATTPLSRIAQEKIQNTHIDVIIITSQASLKQLPKQFSLLGEKWIKEKQLLVLTEEQAQQARKVGFIPLPWVAGQADEKSIVDCLLNHINFAR